LRHEDDLIDVIQRAWEVGDKESLFSELFAEWLSTQDFGSSWYVQKALRQLPLSDLGTEFLLEWVAIDPATRARVLADVIGSPGGRPDGASHRFIGALRSLRGWQCFFQFLYVRNVYGFLRGMDSQPAGNCQALARS